MQHWMNERKRPRGVANNGAGRGRRAARGDWYAPGNTMTRALRRLGVVAPSLAACWLALWAPAGAVAQGAGAAGGAAADAVRLSAAPGAPATASADVLQGLPAVRPGQVGAGSLLLRSPLQGDAALRLAPRLATDIDLTVISTVARVTMRQQFRNPTADFTEAVYVFPLPDDAAVDHLTLRIGERLIVGEIREKTAARREYETARRAGKRAALLSQARPNLFTTSVANIAPGETVAVEIQYQQQARRTDDGYSLRLPLTLTPRYIPGAADESVPPDRLGSGWSRPTDQVPDADRITPQMIAAAPADSHRLTLAATIDAGLPLAAIESRYHAIRVSGGADGRSMSVMLADSSVPLDHDIELTWRPEPQAMPLVSAFRYRQDGDDYVLMTVMPPAPEAAGDAVRLPRDVILVIDTSGSMHGGSIAQARAALTLAVSRLRPADRFNVIQFNSATSRLFDAAVPASPANVALAREYIGGLRAQGGTEMRPALIAAMADAPEAGRLKQIVFVTDGSVGNDDVLFRLIEQRLRGARLFTVGIGSAPNGWFMRKAAEAGRGTFTTISAQGDVAERMGALLGRLERPVLTDIAVDWHGVAADAYPAVMPDLYEGEPILLRARLAGADDGPLDVLLSGQRSGQAWRTRVALPRADASADRRAVATLWARARIEALADQRRRGADPDEVRGRIARVAIEHHLVSEATSLVAVDRTPVRPADTALARRNVASLMPHGQSTETIFGMPATATAGPLQRLTGALALIAGLMLLTLSRIRGLRHAPA
jgi:Ca-activated chloride channel family protein